MVNSYLKNKAIIYLYLVINLDFLFTTRRSIYRYRQHNSRSHNIVRVTGLSTCSDKSKFLLLLTLKFCPLWIWLSPVTLMHLHYCSYSVLSVMMLHLRSAWSKLLCPNALYNVNFCGGPWPDCIEKITNSLKEILQMPAFLFFFFSIKARQEHREPRSLLVTKIVFTYLCFCVCASGTFACIVHCCHFQRNVCYSLSCSFVILLFIPFCFKHSFRTPNHKIVAVKKSKLPC